MAIISIQHEDFNFYRNKVSNFEEFKSDHESNIERFRGIVEEVLQNENGRYLFDYILKYQQFEPLDGPKDIPDEQVLAIEEEYPNCFI